MAEGRNDDKDKMVSYEEISAQGQNGNSKRFDAFFSYNEKDTEIVLKTTEALEQPPYSLKICEHKRDFEYGVPIVENIGKFMLDSKKIVFFLSKSFVDSNWCSFESKIALQLSLGEFKKTILPVLLEECDIPLPLACLTYLDFRKETNYEQLAKAVKEETFEGHSFLVRLASDRFENGEILYTISPKESCETEDIRFEEDVCPGPLLNDSIGLTKKEYKNIIFAINNLPIVQSRLNPRILPETVTKCIYAYGLVKVLYKLRSQCLVIIFFSFLVMCCMIRLNDKPLPNNVNDQLSFSQLMILIALIVLITGLFYFAILKMITNNRTKLEHEKEELSKTILYINRNIREKHLIISYNYKYKEIDFMFFNSSGCHKYLIDKLSTTVKQIKGDLFTREIFRTLNELVEGLIKDNIIQVYLSRKEAPEEIRHSKQGICFCQFLEKERSFPFFTSDYSFIIAEEFWKEGLKNGQVIFKLFARKNKSYCSLGLKFLCTDISTNYSDTLTENELKEIVTVSQNLLYFKLYYSTLLGFALVPLLFGFSWPVVSLFDLDKSVYTACILIVTLLLFRILRLLVLIIHYVRAQKFQDNINTKMISKNIAFHVEDLKIVFLYHFLDPCRGNIIQMIRKGEINVTENQASDLIQKYMYEYLDYRSKLGLGESYINGSHTQSGKCLCKYIREHYWKSEMFHKGHLIFKNILSLW